MPPQETPAVLDASILPEVAIAAAKVGPVAVPVVAEPAAVLPPQFDNWRVDPEGAAVVAGRAEPGAMVVVLLDGAPISQAEATTSGEFVALFTLPPTDMPTLMSLSMTLDDGRVVLSRQTVALEAIRGPVAVADAGEVPPASAEQPAAALEMAPPAAILVTEEGAIVLQDPAPVDPVVMANVSIETISYTPQGNVQLGGRGQAGAFLRLYLDNVALQTVLVPAEGQWLTTLNETVPGLYTLRVDQVDEAGKVTSRFETPFKRETREALSAVETAAAEANPSPVPVPSAVATKQPVGVASLEPDAAPPTAPSVAAPEPRATQPDPVVGQPTVAEKDFAFTAPSEDAAAIRPAQSDGDAADLSVVEAGASDPVPEAAPSVSITVQPGFTLWGIAQENFGDGVLYVQVFEANKDKIKNPNLIYPGQVLTIPTGDGG